MGRGERYFLVWTCTFSAVHVTAFLTMGVLEEFGWIPNVVTSRFPLLLMSHLLVMVQVMVALVLTIRDLYARPFEHANDKLTWLLVILYTGGIGWVVYVWRHALRPRDSTGRSA